MGVLFSRNLRSSATLDTSKSSYASGKNVLITGASAGIGAELARKFAEQGANLALVARNQNNLEAVAKECLELGAIKAEVFPCDLTRDEDTKTAIQNATESFGNFDIVILNAGRSMGCYFEEIRDMESINYMLKLNVNGVIHALLCALPAIPKSEASRIVIVSSVAGLIGVPYRTIYCASKHALAGSANARRICQQRQRRPKGPAHQLPRGSGNQPEHREDGHGGGPSPRRIQNGRGRCDDGRESVFGSAVRNRKGNRRMGTVAQVPDIGIAAAVLYDPGGFPDSERCQEKPHPARRTTR
jgi:NADP-dependent 3-hydroxy acid dehydrogenase YdfG